MLDAGSSDAAGMSRVQVVTAAETNHQAPLQEPTVFPITEEVVREGGSEVSFKKDRDN